MTEPLEHLVKIPEWSGKATERSFVFFNNEFIKENIPVTRIEYWKDFFKLVDSRLFDRVGTELIFRGQRRWDWQLSPTLGREPYSKDGNVTKEKAEKMHALFRQAVRGRLNDSSLVNDSNPDELWAIGQHYGLKTPLLDWTHSPYVALFFAFNEQDPSSEGNDNYYRTVYVLNKSFVESECPEITVVEPKRDDHGRLVNQAGLFTVCHDATIENQLLASLGKDSNFTQEKLMDEDEGRFPEIFADYICKIYIKNEFRHECIKHLRKMNVHHASLFPDLIGASDYCNLIMAEWIEALETNKQHSADAEPKLESTGVVSKLTPKLDVSEQEIGKIGEMLRFPGSHKQMESVKVSMLAKDLASEIKKYQYTDWQNRDSVKATLRIIIKNYLRKAGYPESARDNIISNILTFYELREDMQQEMKDE